MPDKPPLYKQETPYSCAPACLRMVLDYLGVKKTEKELVELCDCMPNGTRPLGVVDAAKACGFEQTRKYTRLTIPDLKFLVEQTPYPIVYIAVRLPPGSFSEKHAVVVIEIDGTGVRLLDPVRGEVVVRLEEFESEWHNADRLTFIIR